MFNPDRDYDTICSLITAPGVSGVSVIRLSGEKSLEIIYQVCDFLPQKIESHRVYYGFLKSIKNEKNIDEVLVTYFKKGRSFTAEESIEISCHGSQLIVKSILKELVNLGARAAERGEFTYRAFINGRIDLVQAESVLSLIESETTTQQNLSLRQLEGYLSKTLLDVEDQLTFLTAQLEANIDYAAEDIVVMSYDKVIVGLNEVREKVLSLTSSYENGSLIKEGFKVAIIGRPNMGKSTLMNFLLEKEKSIVTEIEGTTRDVIDEEMVINNVKFHFFDTAGIRFTEDQVEKIGVKRALDTAQNANILLVVTDTDLDLDFFKNSPELFSKNTQVLVLVNKIDLKKDWEAQRDRQLKLAKEKIEEFMFNFSDLRVLDLSFKENLGVNSLKEYFEQKSFVNFTENAPTLIHLRHFQGLSDTTVLVEKALKLLQSDVVSEELVCFELQNALVKIKEILGKEFNDEIMDRVFSEFCLGK